MIDAFDEPVKVSTGSEAKPIKAIALGIMRFEDVDHYILEKDIDNMDLAYAITVHKAQGSQFPRVIIPIRKSMVLDRTLVYTAITRAERQVILIGDEKSVKQAVEMLPKAFSRKVGLKVMLSEEYLS